MLSDRASAVKTKSELAEDAVSNWELRWKARRRELLGAYPLVAAAMSSKGPALSQTTREGQPVPRLHSSLAVIALTAWGH
jgi:hypothetical protein